MALNARNTSGPEWFSVVKAICRGVWSQMLNRGFRNMQEQEDAIEDAMEISTLLTLQ